MFDSSAEGSGGAALVGLMNALRDLPQDVDDTVRIDRIRLLEELKAVAAAAQARETAAFAAAQRSRSEQNRTADAHVARSIAAQVGLARRISPHSASRYLGWAKVLTTELPGTFGELAAGRITEWRAVLVARETLWLSREHRAQVDSELAPRLERLGDRRVEAEARRIAYRLDPEGFVARRRIAESERRVGLRPAPDAMVKLTATVPVEQGVAAYAALDRHAATVIGQGDARGRGQIMADTLVERITGQATASAVPVEINLVMNEASLVHPSSPDANEPAVLDGYGPIPADLARRLSRDAEAETPVWLRRLFTRPDTGELMAVETRRRCFTPAQRRFIRLRDQQCRTPWCEAPIRHVDHIRPARYGGPTHVANGDGLCETCNYVKEAAGWNSRLIADPSGRHVVETTTPTGHRYRSRPPDLPGTRRPRQRRSAPRILVDIERHELHRAA